MSDMIKASRTALTIAFFVSFGAARGTSAQTLPPSLQGEFFQAYEFRHLGGEVDLGDVDIASGCSASPLPGETFTLTYSARGSAIGPYPGTFTESGTVTVTLTTSSPSYPVGEVTHGFVMSWIVNFTIDSAIGQVSGTKTLYATFPGSSHCYRIKDPFSGLVYSEEDSATSVLDYEATIRTADGTFTDQGVALAGVRSDCHGVPLPAGVECEQESEYFYENFVLSRGVLPLDTTGKATGGGQVGDVSSFARVTFAFEVKQPELGRLQGRCLVNDPAKQARVKCLTVTSYQQVANMATWEGMAEVNGVTEHYRITVQDNGEPNQGIDTFWIKTDTYEAAGNVQHGNVQLHKQKLTP